jgi:hypothetical protein
VRDVVEITGLEVLRLAAAKDLGPWLGPVLNARLPAIKQAIRNVLAMAGGARGGGV